MSEHRHAHSHVIAAQPDPTVGRVVHYVSHGSPVLADGSQKYRPECRAAIVTAVSGNDDSEQTGADVSLAVLNPTGLFFQENLRHSGEHAGGTWHWPERV